MVLLQHFERPTKHFALFCYLRNSDGTGEKFSGGLHVKPPVRLVPKLTLTHEA